MGSLAIGVWLILTSCTPAGPIDFEFTDQWTPTYTTCGWDAWGYPIQEVYLTSSYDPQYPSRECIDAVFADFGLDPEALGLEEDEAYGNLDTTALRGMPAVDVVLQGAWVLFANDFGWDLHENELIDPTYVERMQEVADESGVTGLSPVTYNYITTIVKETVQGDRDDTRWGATFGRKQGLLTVYTFPTWEIYATALLVHEATHGYGYSHRPCINPATTSCDETTEGAFGYQLAFLTTAAGAYVSDDSLTYNLYLFWVQELILHILSFQDYRGVVDEEWERINLREY